MQQPLILAGGDGHTLLAAGTRTTLKIKSEKTGGRFSLAEYSLPAHFPGPPLHVHRRFEHVWYLLDGMLELRLKDRMETVDAGGFVHIPCGVAHTFANPGPQPVRMLAIDYPGGFEPYYEELAAAFADGKTIDRDQIAAIQQRYDTYRVE